MNIALIGYGKMGKAIEEIALQRGHTVPLKIDIDNKDAFNPENLRNCEAAIEFTGPLSAKDNILSCLKAGIPVISGSTGWLEHWNQVKLYCKERNGSLVYASNFSVGMNIFFELNIKLAKLMQQRNDYDVCIEETHHTQKKDAPSGSAITLAEQVLHEISRKTEWVNHASDDPAHLAVFSKRNDPVPGTHRVIYHSANDDIEITHTANNRLGFALGAVIAAEYIHDKKGIFTMKDILGL